MTELKTFRITNQRGLEVDLLNFGARLIGLRYQGVDVVLGYDTIEQYLTDTFSVGATVGRYANRIGLGHLEIDGNTYGLNINEGLHHLHGGSAGLSHLCWTGEQLDDRTVVFSHHSPHGHMGYPGNVEIQILYRLEKEDRLLIDMRGVSDRKTILNLTHHSYFNLHGVNKAGDASAASHEQVLMINAKERLEVDADGIPTGSWVSVEKTPFDFREEKPINSAPNCDHNYCLDTQGALSFAAELSSKKSGLKMSVWTTLPGLQFYGGHYLKAPFKACSGICLEPQFFPDSPNHEAFNTPWVSPEHPYHEVIEFRFSA
ncbi:aldose epimerase family protein [Temperatibacter marinus]|uniref:Aldose epimerase family protein n=1 Tax=Temperatibacter marinus TaxID=1456591 RepID=A0AA52EI34_9PROT|nr:aldose epimerase family protein [Temperatibacter marinus]WND03573.1 aldose epimerase family protein [Temperatibacter marinus]